MFRRLRRAVALYFGTELTWCTSWRLARTGRKYEIVQRNGFLYIEPKVGG